MIRDRLKSGWQHLQGRLRRPLETWTPPPTPSEAPLTTQPLGHIPPVQPGSGDTPGPEHREDIGRPWAVAQLISGAAPFFLDIRPTTDHTAGHIPGAVSAPGGDVLHLRDLLPEPEAQVVVYDADGGELSIAVAAELRAAGWTGARRLVGGFAEWRDQGEPVEHE
ncbi:MAG: rhodanese-like domain-containing protein [Deltaproteobacteria bacterium]|nr:rhodanese-like domain-containing protein [Deltaproteobacteria bacterium]